jgi:hypothetical protein
MVFSHSPIKRLPDCSLFFIYRVYLNNCMHTYCRWHTMYDTIKHDTIIKYKIRLTIKKPIK